MTQKGRDPDSNNTGGCRNSHAAHSVSFLTVTRTDFSRVANRAWCASRKPRHGATAAADTRSTASGHAFATGTKAIPSGPGFLLARCAGT
jgi:hypothetical protein